MTIGKQGWGWAALAIAAILFVPFWSFMMLGSIMVGSDPCIGRAIFNACDQRVGYLQDATFWGGLSWFVAPLIESRRRWWGTALLILTAALITILWLTAYR